MQQCVQLTRPAACLGLVLLLLGAAPTRAGEAVKADLVYQGGTVITMDSDRPQASAVAIGGERILAVGTPDDIEAMIGPETAVVELGDRVLIPGFIDAHSHLLFQGRSLVEFVDLNSPPVGKIRRMDELLAALKARAAVTPAGEWVVGFGYDDTGIVEMRHPTRLDLDQVSTRHPIWINHSSGHLGVANTVALNQAGITADTPSPAGSRIHKDAATGEPNGVFEEEGAMGLVMADIYSSTDEQMLAAIPAALADYASKGITSAQDGAGAPDTLRGLALARDAGLLLIRVIVYPVGPLSQAIVAGRYTLPFTPDNFLKTGATKLFADGSIQGYTGYLDQPYHVPRDLNEPDYRGYPRQRPQELQSTVLMLHRAGRQVAIHGNGDAAIDDILTAIAAAQQAAPRKDARHIVIHSQMVREDQLDRMATLGVVPSFFNMHSYYWGDRHRDRFLGTKRAERISPLRSAAARDLRFTLHADTPVVPMDPLRMLWSAVRRETASGATLGAAQTIPAQRALKALTIDAAYQNFEEHEKGSITAGKLADLVLLDRNPLTIDSEQLLAVKVLATVVGGKTIYEAGVTRSP